MKRSDELAHAIEFDAVMVIAGVLGAVAIVPDVLLFVWFVLVEDDDLPTAG